MTHKGLTNDEVNQRILEKKVNGEPKRLSKSTINIIEKIFLLILTF